LRRAGEGQDRLLPGDDVAHFDGIADRPDVRIGRPHPRIEEDAAARTEGQARGDCKPGLGPDADRVTVWNRR
jgi:hypothetical protein